MSSPSNPQYKMPAEWYEHEATWLAWPYDRETFPDRVEKVELAVAKMIRAIHKSEKIELLVLNQQMRKRASEIMESTNIDSSEVNFHITDYADIWLRDSGPIFVHDSMGNVVPTNWQFNAWGNKFPELLIDGEIPSKVSHWINLALLNADLVLEGGAIEVNGNGVCLTTEQCLLNPNRNPAKSKEEIEYFLHKYLGIVKTVWLKEGLVNDHTDGHIDELARFVSENVIICGYEENQQDENREILESNYKTLCGSSNAQGNPFEIIKLPMPHMRYEDGVKAPVSYTNFYIGNNIVLVPQFNDPNDRPAIAILENCFPNREIVGIDCSDIIYGGGAIHCITQQQPK